MVKKDTEHLILNKIQDIERLKLWDHDKDSYTKVSYKLCKTEWENLCRLDYSMWPVKLLCDQLLV